MGTRKKSKVHIGLYVEDKVRDRLDELARTPLTLVLIACASRKVSYQTRADNLYRSTLFLYSRRWAWRHADAWWILSALHGVLTPSEQVSPYNQTLNTMSQKERAAWACRVRGQLSRGLVRPGDRVVILAGVRYREGLMDWLQDRGCVVETPLEGMPIGKQVQWLRLNSR